MTVRPYRTKGGTTRWQYVVELRPAPDGRRQEHRRGSPDRAAARSPRDRAGVVPPPRRPGGSRAGRRVERTTGSRAVRGPRLVAGARVTVPRQTAVAGGAPGYGQGRKQSSWLKQARPVGQIAGPAQDSPVVLPHR